MTDADIAELSTLQTRFAIALKHARTMSDGMCAAMQTARRSEQISSEHYALRIAEDNLTAALAMLPKMRAIVDRRMAQFAAHEAQPK